jgi:hypothetical protein
LLVTTTHTPTLSRERAHPGFDHAHARRMRSRIACRSGVAFGSRSGRPSTGGKKTRFPLFFLVHVTSRRGRQRATCDRPGPSRPKESCHRVRGSDGADRWRRPRLTSSSPASSPPTEGCQPSGQQALPTSTGRMMQSQSAHAPDIPHACGPPSPFVTATKRPCRLRSCPMTTAVTRSVTRGDEREWRGRGQQERRFRQRSGACALGQPRPFDESRWSSARARARYRHGRARTRHTLTVEGRCEAARARRWCGAEAGRMNGAIVSVRVRSFLLTLSFSPPKRRAQAAATRGRARLWPVPG